MSEERKGSEEARSFEEIVQELSGIVERLEKGGLPLEKALEEYVRGRELLKQARHILDQAQARLQELVTDESGAPRLKDLDVESMTKGAGGEG